MHLRRLDQTFVFGEGKAESESGWALLQKGWETIYLREMEDLKCFKK